jgi:hypothetical protein
MESTVETSIKSDKMVPAIRVQGKWYKVMPKQYEPERQTYNIAYAIISKGITPEVAYREWFAQERKDAKLLYPSFRNE